LTALRVSGISYTQSHLGVMLVTNKLQPKN